MMAGFYLTGAGKSSAIMVGLERFNFDRKTGVSRADDPVRPVGWAGVPGRLDNPWSRREEVLHWKLGGGGAVSTGPDPVLSRADVMASMRDFTCEGKRGQNRSERAALIADDHLRPCLTV